MTSNIPNRLTTLRILMVPIYAVVMYIDFPFHYVVAGIIFLLASITDTIDGRYARKHNMVTDFGKFADPVADKILVLTSVIIFVGFGRLPAWTCAIMVAREIIVTSLRNVAVLKNRVLAADIYGKLKTTFQMIAITILHFEGLLPFLAIPTDVLYYIAVALTVLSGANYCIKNWDILSWEAQKRKR